MYSMVLMAALTTGGETPDIGRRGGRGGCCGCTGGMAYGGGRRGGRRGGGCYGGGYGGCYGGGMGYGYGGCYGGMGYGGGWGGCYGGGMGYGYGGMAYGGCYGGGMAYGGGMGYPMMGAGCVGGTYMGTGGVIQGAGTGGEQIQKMPKPDKKGSGEESMAPAPATILVTLPADARLSVDGKPTTSTSTSRAFVSPDLPRGREFHYTLKAEIVRDGKPVSVTREVAVRAGETIPVTINIPPTGVARR